MIKNIALFDFDGTISTKDSLSEFLKFIEPNPFRYIFFKYIYCFFENIAYKLKLLSYNDLKKKRINSFFNNKNYDDLVLLGTEFGNNILPKLIKQSALNKIESHLQNNDDVYVVSASLDIILQSWCSKNNINLITNKIDSHKKIYIGADCNYDTKVIMLKNRVDLGTYNLIYAYGDSEGDIPMLNLAHKSYYKFFN